MSKSLCFKVFVLESLKKNNTISMKELHIKSSGLKKKKPEVVREVDIDEDVELEAENKFEVQPIEKSEDKEVLDVDDASDFVKVKFDKFVQLMANHDFKSVMDKYVNEDLILRTNLLTDLANAHSEEKKRFDWSVFFAVGIVLGIVAAYVLFKFF